MFFGTVQDIIIRFSLANNLKVDKNRKKNRFLLLLQIRIKELINCW